MVNKLKIYILTNIFNKHNTIFIPKTDKPEIEELIDKYSQNKISSGGIKKLNEYRSK